MRKVIRNQPPECLITGAPDWTKDFVAARNADSSYRFTWRSDACYQALRKQLVAMTQGHCAFCDGAIGTESRETVEHFRPKGAFEHLAYEWTNLFPCCDMCQSKKLENFDEKLLKPDETDYYFENFFVSNYKTGEIEPLPCATVQDRNRAEVTIRLYGLNLGSRAVARLRELAHYARDPEKNIDDYNYRFFLE